MLPIRTILHATDFSTPSEFAFGMACSLARDYKARLVIVHVKPLPVTAIGEFGAVSVVSGKIAGQTMTLTLLVEQRFSNFDLAGAYAASALLATIAFATLLLMTRIKPR